MVDRIQIAGDFGRYLNIEKAVTIYYPKANPAEFGTNAVFYVFAAQDAAGKRKSRSG